MKVDDLFDITAALNRDDLWGELFKSLSIYFKNCDSFYLLKCPCSKSVHSILFETRQQVRFSCTGCGVAKEVGDSWLNLCQHLTSLSRHKIIQAAETLVEQTLAEKKSKNELSAERKIALGIYEIFTPKTPPTKRSKRKAKK